MNNTRILRMRILHIYYIKNEYKYLILKSIIQNKAITPTVRYFCIYKLNKLSRKNRISFQKNICLVLKKYRGVFSYMSLKRHTIQKLFATAEIPNIINNSW